MQVVAVPVKEPARSKSRLAGVLSEPERAALTTAMLEDVLSAVAGLDGWDAWVISRDDRVLSAGRRLGARSVPEEGRSLNAAVRQIEAALPRDAALAVLLGDLPWLAAEELRAALDTAGPVVAAPASSDGGTNLLLRRPGSVIPARFGPASFIRHRAEADRAGLELATVRSPGLEQDLDRPADLARFVAAPRAGSTAAVCHGLGLAGRLLARTATRRG